MESKLRHVYHIHKSNKCLTHHWLIALSSSLAEIKNHFYYNFKLLKLYLCIN